MIGSTGCDCFDWRRQTVAAGLRSYRLKLNSNCDSLLDVVNTSRGGTLFVHSGRVLDSIADCLQIVNLLSRVQYALFLGE
jgi:hypothetical protein